MKEKQASVLRLRFPSAAISWLAQDGKPKEASADGGRVRLQQWHELPEWQQEDNEFIETGYRPASKSTRVCLQSWLYLHNESVNIFSHLIGIVIFLLLWSLIYRELASRYDSGSTHDMIVFAIYLFSITVCFMLSVIFHTLLSHSELHRFGIQLDFQGIITLIWGASVPMIYYTFHKEPAARMTYWSLVSVFACLASAITFTPYFLKPATRPLRAAVFGSFATSTLAAVVHGLSIHGWAQQSARFPMWGVGLTMLFNALGALAYALKFPERWWRRRFDFVGASHQILHVMVIFAGLSFLAGMLTAFDNLHSTKGIVDER